MSQSYSNQNYKRLREKVARSLYTKSVRCLFLKTLQKFRNGLHQDQKWLGWRRFWGSIVRYDQFHLFESLHTAFEKYWKVHDVSFQEFGKAKLLINGVSIEASVDLVPTDSPNNSRRFENRLNLQHDVFSNHDISFLIDIYYKALNLGTRSHIFWFKSSFRTALGRYLDS